MNRPAWLLSGWRAARFKEKRLRFIPMVLFAISFASPATAELRYYVLAETKAAKLYRVIHEGGQRTVYATGEIATGDSRRLRVFLRERSIITAKVALDSSGGSLAEGMALGQTIRSMKLDTAIEATGTSRKAICASACAYAFAGGVNRFYDDAAAKLGVHRFYSTSGTEATEDQVQMMSGAVVSYLSRMGVDANAFSLSTLAGENDMVWLSAKDAEALAFANNGTQPTTAEIKTLEMTPYLRLEQVRNIGRARVLFFCEKKGMSLMAGVVASHQEAVFNSEISKKSYIELDGNETLVSGAGGTEVDGDVMWLERLLDGPDISQIVNAKQFNIWTEGGGAVRWGAMLDLRPVNAKLRAYVADCGSTQK